VYWALITLGPLLIGVSLTLSSHVFMATSDLVGHVPILGRADLHRAVAGADHGYLHAAVRGRAEPRRGLARRGVGRPGGRLAFELAKRGFAIFITQFPTYSKIYGALAAVPLFLLWVYVSWLITLFGALLVAALPVVKYERWWHEAQPGGEFVDAMAILKVLHVACKCGDTAWSARPDPRAHAPGLR
jgi:membrane protein